MRKATIDELIEKVLTGIERIGECDLVLTCSDGTLYRFWHEQKCCEYVRLEDICGDLDDLVGAPIVEAEEVSSPPPTMEDKKQHVYFTSPGYTSNDSYDWTFYRLSAKGTVTFRWLGESNGCYSERVEFDAIDENDVQHMRETNQDMAAAPPDN